jgi:hypothetical protein
MSSVPSLLELFPAAPNGFNTVSTEYTEKARRENGGTWLSSRDSK